MDAALAQPIGAGLEGDEIREQLRERFSTIADPQNPTQIAEIVQASQVLDVLRWLRDEEALQFKTLLEITIIDYLSYPGWREERFGVVYLLRSLRKNHRIQLKVYVDEDEPSVASAHQLFPIANWLEREAFDQYGIQFDGHPDLRRLLNHHEFVGHPLRKDYPVQKRQHLSNSDSLIDPLVARLEHRGFTVEDVGEEQQG